MPSRLTYAELVHVMELATRCLFVGTRDDLVDVISELYSVIPFRKAVMCRLSCVGDKSSIVEFINHSYGSEWASVYARERFESIDPILRYSATNAGAFSWKDVAFNGDDTTRRFFDAAREFGIVDGASFVCGAGTDTNPRTLLSIAGDQSNTLDRTSAILTVFGPHLHEAYGRVLNEDSSEKSPVELTTREMEVLNWKQHGKTFWEIGSILGISQRTVKYHFARIATKLEVVGSAHAVAKALRLGIIR